MGRRAFLYFGNKVGPSKRTNLFIFSFRRFRKQIHVRLEVGTAHRRVVGETIRIDKSRTTI
jgi:hypothetical protein